MGATVGRFANRIHQASFSIKDTTYQLEKNDGENTNHGGASGFHKKIWQWEQIDSGIRFILHSPDMEGGYPGNVHVKIEYQFTETNELTISYYGITDRPTYLNLTNHAYFNLSGDKRKITEHQLMIPVTRILETTSQFIPTGHMQDVKDSPFDFTISHSIGMHLYDDDEQLHWNKGYNHCYILKEESSDTLLTAAVLSDPFSGRKRLSGLTYPVFYYIPPAISLPHRISVYAWRRSTSRIPLRIRIFLPACSCRGRVSPQKYLHIRKITSPCCPHADILCLRMDSKNFLPPISFLFIYLFYICDKQKSNNMKTSIVTFLITFCFYLSALCTSVSRQRLQS